MTWDQVQQVLRIVLYTLGGWFFGDIAEGDLFNSALGGLMAVGSFIWWFFWERAREDTPR